MVEVVVVVEVAKVVEVVTVVGKLRMPFIGRDFLISYDKCVQPA